ncbi:hypothetical protein PybrP1_009215 [[Pythium] brassicae (nom. inval.)]|nr:hypothetical protein PybrP1_009215 [[Pythium] brassicae (nom. inval.)]
MLTRGAARLAWRSRSSAAPAAAALAGLPCDRHSQSCAPPRVAHLHMLAAACRRPVVVAPGLLALADEYLETLHHASESHNGWRAALEVFEEIRAAKGAGLTVDVATALIELLGARKRFSECIDVLRYSREQGVRPRIHAYSSAIACCYQERMFVQALKVFEVMRNDGYVPKVVTYSRALSAALKSAQHELVLEIFDDMLRNKVETSIVIYNNILNSCARVGDGHSALGVLRAIKQRELPMTQSTYHSLAICAGKTGLSDLALEMLAGLLRDGFEPTMTIYNSAISACAKGKRWKAIVGIYDAMRDDMRAQLGGLYLGGVLMALAKSPEPERKLRAVAIFTERKAAGEELNLRLDWHNALTHALELPDRALYWNFRKWMAIRAAGIIHEVPAHLILPDDTKKLKKQPEKEPPQAPNQLQLAEGHSWIDCIDTDRSVVYDKARDWIYGGETANGRCKGYITNYPGRGDPAINSKMTHKILMNDVVAGAAPCPTFGSITGGDAKGFPHLKVKAGEQFYFGYLDNGHTSKDKAGRGTYYGVYWTGESGTSLKSTTDLTDDRLIDGKLHDFDDKNCGQTWEDGDFTGTIPSGRAGNDYPCVGDLQVPAGTKPGTYNLIWFWRFYNDKITADIATTGGHYGGAAYSSCFQVEVVGGEVENEAEDARHTNSVDCYAGTDNRVSIH